LDAMHMPARLVSALKSMLQPAGRGVHGRKRAGGAAPEAPAAPRTPGACLGPGDVAGESWSGSQGSAAARCGFLWKTKGPKKTFGNSPEQPRILPVQPRAAPSGPYQPRVGAAHRARRLLGAVSSGKRRALKKPVEKC
jgi:hypothetical protein